MKSRLILTSALVGGVAVSLTVGLSCLFRGDTTAEGSMPADPLSQARKVALEVQEGQAPPELAGYCSSLTNGGNPYVGTAQREDLTDRLTNPHFHGHHGTNIRTRQALARDYLRFGEAADAVKLLRETLDVEVEEDPEGQHRSRILEALGIAYLQIGVQHSSFSLLNDPALDELLNEGEKRERAVTGWVQQLDGTFNKAHRRGARGAVKSLRRLLEDDPDNSKAVWLLNIAHMIRGTYPGDVREEYLIPPTAFEGAFENPIRRFRDVSVESGLHQDVEMAGGSIIEDFDNDGRLDIVASTWDPCKPISYFHNNGDGTFSDHTDRAGLSGQLGGLNITQTDYNDDGHMDIYVMRGGWLGPSGQMRNSLLRNERDGTFTDVTAEAELASPAYPNHSSAWADYDGDGDLDAFVCNESQPDTDVRDISIFPSQLFTNNGDGTFSESAADAGVRNSRFCKGTAAGDYDNDGDPDIYVSNFGSENRLYRNNGDGTFTDMARTLGVTEPVSSFATWFWDYNNDGRLDLLVAGYGVNIADVGLDDKGAPNDSPRMRLYRNGGENGFSDVTKQTGLYNVHLTMGANFGDLDNDGFQDFYLGTGFPSFDAIGPNVMYRNDAGQRFQDVTFRGGFGNLQKGHGVAFGDIDRDGDQDIFAQTGGFFHGTAFSNALYENPGHGNRWISVRLAGTVSNRAAIGARIEVRIATPAQTRTVHARVTSGGSFGASSLEQEIGLGQAQQIESLTIRWPTSGVVQTFTDVPLDSLIEIREGSEELLVRSMPSKR